MTQKSAVLSYFAVEVWKEVSRFWKSEPPPSELTCSMAIFCPFLGKKGWFTRKDQEPVTNRLQTGYEPVTNRPRTGHEPVTKRPRTGHGPTKNRLRTGHEPTTNRPRTSHGPTTNWLRTGHEPATNVPRTGNEPTTTGYKPATNLSFKTPHHSPSEILMTLNYALRYSISTADKARK
jgi:hypothetical protein